MIKLYRPFTPDPDDTFKVKRNFAIAAFVVMSCVIFDVLYLVKTGDANTAAMLMAAQGIIIVVLPILAIPITQYFYMTGEKKKAKAKKKSD